MSNDSQQDQRSGAIEEDAIVVVFGASGDLAKKSTFPALFALLVEGLLPANTRILGYARSKMSDEKFDEQLFWKIRDDEKEGHIKANDAKKEEFKRICKYVQGPYDKDEGFQGLEKEMRRIENEEFDGKRANRVFYLALPPSSFAQVSHMIKKNNYWSGKINRLVIEKPFGKDTEDCRAMMDSIAEDWKEDEIYRIDHYLGEEMIRAIYHLRFANRFIEPLLNREHVESISVVMKEKFGAEGRGGYFDEFGMIRDVGQNHLLQAISILTMDPPDSMDNDSMRDNKVEVLKSIPPIENSDLVLGQYAKGDGKKSYVDDETVPDDSKTATFAQWAMKIDNERWKGVPVLVKCGKALDEGIMSMTFNFKAPKHNIFNVFAPSALVVRLNPEPAIYFKTNLLKPLSKGSESISDEMKYTVPGRKVAGDKLAYEVVIGNVFKGDQSGFVREDEVIASWEIFTPLLRYIEGPNGPTPIKYAYGSHGPEEQFEFEKRFSLPVDQ